ncbi:hypothetical protein [Aeromonas hydrophila]|uniref:hypothetical protein n=1 Tax=Aeromonas hydrophila TaxID=644 RepID=UPI00188F330D|nr:hypothetical protein [Aeromonas hydrophila]MBF4800373.1 hypothetical protein [Aeromonas hydrophila]
MDILLFAEVRNWLMFGLGVIGGVMALLTYSRGQNQRRLENSFRMIQLFRDTITAQDFEQWVKLFNASSESSGAKVGHFVSEDGLQTPFSVLYAEGAPDDGAIDRIAQVLDLVSEHALLYTFDLRIFYHEYGQLMDKIYRWLSKAVISDEKYLLEVLYPNLNLIYVKKKIDPDWSCRRYVNRG